MGGVALKKEFQLCYTLSSDGERELNDSFMSHKNKSSSKSLDEHGIINQFITEDDYVEVASNNRKLCDHCYSTVW